MVHQDAEGTTTEHPITDDYQLELGDLDRMPGTTAALASGAMFGEGDPEVPYNHGLVYTYVYTYRDVSRFPPVR